MIRITDMTLCCIESCSPTVRQLKMLYELLLLSGADLIEMPTALYALIQPAAADKLVLRVSNPGEASEYPAISRFVCRKSGFISSPAVTLEIQMNDVKEINFLGQNDAHENVRLVGLDDILCHDFESAFAKIRIRLNGRIELCPENSYSCATAAAIEWLSCGGVDVAASFGGIGGKASLEEILVALRVIKRHKPTASFAVYPEIAALIEDITATRFADRKAVIGRKIFNVESGIHVDGILKKPQMYEPYLPELVGSSRNFIIGKHSGRKSIAAKLGEMGYTAGAFDIARLLAAVRDESILKMSSLTDEEFYKIAEHYRLE